MSWRAAISSSNAAVVLGAWFISAYARRSCHIWVRIITRMLWGQDTLWGVIVTDSQLGMASLLVRATEATGLSDFGEDSWEEGLDRLVHSLHAEGDLSEVGEVVASTMIVDFLKSRLRVIDWHHRHPEIGTMI